MAKVLLISPPFYRLMGSHYNGLHLGLGYISSVLKRNGHDVLVYNADYEESGTYIDQRQIFDNFNSYKKILNDLHHPIWKEVSRVIGECSPDHIGIQMYTGTYRSAQIVASIARSIVPAAKIVVGGTHPTLDPAGTIQHVDYDYVVRGEGEYAFLELVSGVHPSNVKGLTFRDESGSVVHNSDRPFIADLDTLPYPSRDGFYKGAGNIDVGAIITARGCPFECRYCASPEIWGRKTNFRSVAGVLGELEHMVRDHGVRFVRFQDDTFTLQRDRAAEICRGIERMGSGIEWVCDTRVDRLDGDLLGLMKSAGCVRVKMGVESGSDDILNKMNKGITTGQIRRAVQLVREVDIPLTIYLMIGFPGETDDDARRTIKFAEEINADYNSLSIISPYFGTRLYRDMEKKGSGAKEHHWEYFFHQSREMIMNTQISEKMVDRFFGLNDIGKKSRV